MHTKNDALEAIKQARELGLKGYIPKLFRFTQKKRINPKTDKPYDGVHMVYSGMAKILESVFEKPIAEIAADAVKAGIIETPEPRQGGFVWYLKGEKPVYDPNKKAKKDKAASQKLVDQVLGSLG